MTEIEIEYNDDEAQVSLTAEIWPIQAGSHVWTGEYGIATDAGLDGPYDLGQGTEDEIRQRVLAAAVEAGATEKADT